jgi:dihydrodipicolinate synthase/N-acetylneuraminate lyase
LRYAAGNRWSPGGSKNIIGIKEATGNLSRVHQIKELVSDDFILLSGDDATGMDFMQLGGQGVISVTATLRLAKWRICADWL